MNPGRRKLLGQIAATFAATLVHSRPARAASGRVIVVGAGFGGATCAKYLRALSPASDIVLIEKRPEFLTGPFSNLVIAGLREPASIRRRSARIAAAHHVRLLLDEVVECDPVALRVRTARHGTLAADHIVVSPGIAMRWHLIEGLSKATSPRMPHAWLGDAQVSELRTRLRAVPDGATILIAAPPNPYRCPPGPYERASLIADFLKRSGRKRTKVLIADCKDDFSLRPLFQLEWDLLYPGVIEWIPRAQNGTVVRVDPVRGEVWLQGASAPLRVALATVIPGQRAADLAARCDLADESGWCPVDPTSFESRRHARVHVVGDAASAAPMPKSAFAANSQAKLCAASIAAALAGDAAPAARLLNTCYSLVSAREAISVSELFAADGGRLVAVSAGQSALKADEGLRRHEALQAYAWYQSITTDSFGSA